MARKLSANRGASLSRQSVVAKLRRDRKAAPFSVGEYITGFIAWVNGQSTRAAKKPGGLGK